MPVLAIQRQHSSNTGKKVWMMVILGQRGHLYPDPSSPVCAVVNCHFTEISVTLEDEVFRHHLACKLSSIEERVFVIVTSFNEIRN